MMPLSVKEYIMRYENEILQLLPDKIQPLVRCKDCKHQSNSLCCPIALLADVTKQTKVFDYKVGDDWFCADGERRDE